MASTIEAPVKNKTRYSSSIVSGDEDMFWDFIKSKAFDDEKALQQIDLEILKNMRTLRFKFVQIMTKSINSRSKLYNMLHQGFAPDARDPTQPSIYQDANFDIISIFAGIAIIKGRDQFYKCIDTDDYRDFLIIPKSAINAKYISILTFSKVSDEIQRQCLSGVRDIYDEYLKNATDDVKDIMSFIPVSTEKISIFVWITTLANVQKQIASGKPVHEIKEYYKNKNKHTSG